MRGRYPGELSLGLARRVAIARAFAIEPSLILLDEPFVSLDEPTATRLRALLTEVWSARPTTALMVTHNLREALELSDRIVFLTERPIESARRPRDRHAETGARSGLAREGVGDGGGAVSGGGVMTATGQSARFTSVLEKSSPTKSSGQARRVASS